jgi:hypothetical protein
VVKNLPLLGANAEITPSYAEKLLGSSHPGPERSHGESAISADRGWYIKSDSLEQLRPPSQSLACEEVIEIAHREIDRLEELGIEVISRAFVANRFGTHIYTFTPYLTAYSPCSAGYFEGKISTQLSEYFSKPASHFDPITMKARALAPPFLWDIRSYHQFSSLTGDVMTAFLHDVDPLLSNNASEAYTYHKQLGNLSLNAL